MKLYFTTKTDIQKLRMTAYDFEKQHFFTRHPRTNHVFVKEGVRPQKCWLKMYWITGNNWELYNQTSNENDFLTINIGVDVLSRQLPGPSGGDPFRLLANCFLLFYVSDAISWLTATQYCFSVLMNTTVYNIDDNDKTTDDILICTSP